MILNQQTPDMFDESSGQSFDDDVWPSYRARRFITMAILAVLVGAGVWAVWPSPTPRTLADVPVIHSEGDYKERPQQPGGIDIPHQDTAIYQTLDNKDMMPVVDKLATPSEVPQAVSDHGDDAKKDLVQEVEVKRVAARMGQLEVLLSAEAVSGSTDHRLSTEAVMPENSGALQEEQAGTSNSPMDKGTDLPNIGPVTGRPAVKQADSSVRSHEGMTRDAVRFSHAEEGTSQTETVMSAAVREPKAQKIQAATVPQPDLPSNDQLVKQQPKTVSGVAVTSLPSMSGNVSVTTEKKAKPSTMNDLLATLDKTAKNQVVVQLASLPNQAEADATRLAMVKKYAAALKGVSLHVQRADLGAKGIYFRIQSQSIPRSRAEEICQSVKSLNAGCILVGR